MSSRGSGDLEAGGGGRAVETQGVGLLGALPWTQSTHGPGKKNIDIDDNPPGSPVPGILQARILEWVAISFSNA